MEEGTEDDQNKKTDREEKGSTLLVLTPNIVNLLTQT
jgi:hypothetical protein